MRTLLAMTGVLAGVVLGAAPAYAHGATIEKPIVTAEKDLPKGPRICLFSQNGKRAEPAPETGDTSPAPQELASHPAIEHKKQDAPPVARDVVQAKPAPDEKRETVRQAQQTAKPTERVCDTDVPAAAPPHG